MKKAIKIIFTISILNTFISCVMDTKHSLAIKNISRDTLFVEISPSDTFDNLMYWSNKYEGEIPAALVDTTKFEIKGETITVCNNFKIRPETIKLYSLNAFNNSDTCYIYAIKSYIVERFTPDDIHKQKLYERRIVTKKDFDDDGIYEYKNDVPYNTR